MSLPQYLYILGRQPEFGLAELESLAPTAVLKAFGDAAISDTNITIDRLGGSQKIARLVWRGPATKLEDLKISGELLPPSDGKFQLGLSIYGLLMTTPAVRQFGISLKRLLKPTHPSIRVVSPQRGASLSAAQLKFEKVLSKGAELIIVFHGNEAAVGITEQFQDIDAYTARDRLRPARDSRVGMLPPKLAQMLVNLTGGGITPVFDPFCGTGVVLQEALLLGRPATGSDMAEAMVKASKMNLVWLANQTPTPIPSWQIDLADARTVKLPDHCAVVSEGYLGKPLHEAPKLAELASLKSELSKLYRDTLTNFAQQLPSGARLCICIPAWRVGKRFEMLPVIDQLSDLGYTLRQFAQVDTRHLMYWRPGQITARQLLVMEKP